MPRIRISPTGTTRKLNGFTVDCAIDGPFAADRLFFDVVGSRVASPPRDLNWAMVALLCPAMRLGCDLVIEGAVSERLLSYVNTDLQAALQIYEPSFTRIAVSSAGVSTDRRAKLGRIATGFSGGIDSFATLSLYGSGRPRRIHDLCCFNVGAFGNTSDPNALRRFDDSLHRLEQCAPLVGCDYFAINSNIADFYECFPLFRQTHTLRNVAAALTLENCIDEYLCSSTYALKAVGVMPYFSTAIMDPIILPMLSTESTSFASSGAGLSRFEKTSLVAANEMSYAHLDVCVLSAERRRALPRTNCSACWKCNRTLLTLDALGALAHYEEVFDLEFYARNKKKAIREVAFNAFNGSELDEEVIRRLDPQAFQMPSYGSLWAQKWLAKLRQAVKWARRRTKVVRPSKKQRARVRLPRSADDDQGARRGRNGCV